jgi:hypothetical protein
VDGVKTFGILLRQVPKAHRPNLESCLFDALDDLADMTCSDRVRLDDGKRCLHIRPIISITETVHLAPPIAAGATSGRFGTHAVQRAVRIGRVFRHGR